MMNSILRTLGGKVGLLTLAMVAAFFVAPSVGHAQTIGNWSFNNLWAPKTFSKYTPAGSRVQVKVRACTMAAFNPLNRISRLRVQLIHPSGRVLASRYCHCNNSERTFYLTYNRKFPSCVFKVKLTPMDNGRFRGNVQLRRYP